MTLKQRIRYLCDGLRAGEWLTLADFRERLGGSGNSIATAVSQMAVRDQLKRRGNRKSYAYRSGTRPVVEKRKGVAPKTAARLGFMALARLERTDPAAYAKAVAGNRRRA